MKSRRLILTLECVTTYTLAEIRAALTHVALSHGRWITRYPDNEDDGMPNRIEAVRVEGESAIVQRFVDAGRSAGGGWSKLAKDLENRSKRKAKRAKGAK